MPVIASQSETVCYHCGDVCRATSVTDGDKTFCCHGCLAVHELLRKNRLGEYYRLQDAPGRAQVETHPSSDFAFLDDSEVVNRLLDFRDSQISRTRFRIPTIHCSSCIWLLEKLYRLNAGITHSRVNFPRRELTVLFDHRKLSLRQLVELLSSIGYEPQLCLDNLAEQENIDAAHSLAGPGVVGVLYRRLAVAGFCFGNVMLLRLPQYLSPDGGLESGLAAFFSYLSIFLALPVFLYCSTEFFGPAFNGLRQRVVTMDVPIALGILSLFGWSLYEILVLGGGGYLDSFTGLVFFLLIGRLYQRKTYDNLSFDRDYRAYFPIATIRKEPDGERAVAVNSLKPGDTICIRNRELIPVDAVLTQGRARIDYRFVSGESEAHSLEPGDKVYAGGRQIGPRIELSVMKKASQSYLAQLWNHEAFTNPDYRSLTTLADSVGRWFTFVVLGIALLVAAYWLVSDPTKALRAATAVLIVACPCALALSVPFALGTALRILTGNRFYLKNIRVVEALSRVTSIVFDKTGTITHPGGMSLKFVGTPLSGYQKWLVQSLARHSTHPLSERISASLDKGTPFEVYEYHEEPGCGLSGTVGGHQLRLGSYSWVGVTPAGEQDSRPDGEEGAADLSCVYLSLDGQAIGHFQFYVRFRAGLERVVRALQSSFGLTVLSGDNQRSRPVLQKIFGDRCRMEFEQSPHDKLRHVQDDQAAGERVLMVGDGLNDAGALKVAHVGVAVTDDTTAFTPGCDAILEGPRLVSLPDFLRLARRSMDVVKIGFCISFVYNVVGLSFAARAMLSPLLAAILMPLSSVSVVLFATLAVRVIARRMRLG